MKGKPMKKSNLILGVAALVALTLTVALPLAQDSQTELTDEEKIADAISAAPSFITYNATVMDWDMRVLREGTNGWVCQPSTPVTLAAGSRDPWCIDEVWQAWSEALAAQTEPVTLRPGISYMLAGGLGSNTDPYATGPTDDNDWHADGPHIMILVPDLSTLEGVTSEHQSGGPYVMFPNTPYAHLMVLVEPHLPE
jgi:hypothetical protein